MKIKLDYKQWMVNILFVWLVASIPITICLGYAQSNNAGKAEMYHAQVKELKFENEAQQNTINFLTNQVNEVSKANQTLDKMKISKAPHEKSGATVEQLNKALATTNLKGYGESFYKMEQETGTNSLFAMAVMRLESGNGYQYVNNNVFGLASGAMKFNNFDSCIMYFGRLIANNYGDLQTIDAIGKRYCPPNISWSTKVKQLLDEVVSKL